MGFGGTQLRGELLEVKGEYVEESVRPLGSQDLCTVVQTTGTLGSGSNPFPGPVLEPAAIPLTDAIQQLLAHLPGQGAHPLLRQLPRVWGVRLCRAIHAAGDCKSFPWLPCLFSLTPGLSSQGPGPAPARGHGLLSAPLGSLSSLWPGSCPMARGWPWSPARERLFPRSGGLRICSCTAWRWCSARPAPTQAGLEGSAQRSGADTQHSQRSCV